MPNSSSNWRKLSPPTSGPIFEHGFQKQKRRRKTCKSRIFGAFWSECRDLNPRPLGPEPSAIPSFATPRCMRKDADTCQRPFMTCHIRETADRQSKKRSEEFNVRIILLITGIVKRITRRGPRCFFLSSRENRMRAPGRGSSPVPVPRCRCFISCSPRTPRRLTERALRRLHNGDKCIEKIHTVL